MSEFKLDTASTSSENPWNWRRVAKTALGATGLVAAATVAVAPFQATSTEVDGSLGPHDATYRIIRGDHAEITAAPLGTLYLPESLLGYSVRATVGEIPLSPDSKDGSINLSGITQADIDSYLQLFGDPSADINQAKKDLLLALTKGSAEKGLLIGAGLWALYGLLGSQRRKELLKQLDNRSLTVFATLAAVSTSVGFANLDHEQLPPTQPVSILDNTSLEGTLVSGKFLTEAINDFGPKAKQFIEETEAFEDTIRQNLANQKAKIALAGDDEDVMLDISDLHCNFPMINFVGDVSEIVKPRLVLDTGDDTNFGLDEERRCITAQKVIKGQMVTAGGNHDSPITEQQKAAIGSINLDGSVTDVKGYKIIGDDDPVLNVFGNGKINERGESEDEMGQRLSDEACNAADGGQIDIYMVHEPAAARQIAETACAKLVLYGHMHARKGPEVFYTKSGKRVIVYQSSTTGGAANGYLPLGPIKTTAELTLWYFNKSTHDVVGYQIFQVTPDGQVEILPRVDFSPNPNSVTGKNPPKGLEGFTKKLQINPEELAALEFAK